MLKGGMTSTAVKTVRALKADHEEKDTDVDTPPPPKMNIELVRAAGQAVLDRAHHPETIMAQLQSLANAGLSAAAIRAYTHLVPKP